MSKVLKRTIILSTELKRGDALGSLIGPEPNRQRKRPTTHNNLGKVAVTRTHGGGGEVKDTASEMIGQMKCDNVIGSLSVE